MPHQQQNSQKDVQIQPKTNPKLLLIEIWASVNNIRHIFSQKQINERQCFTHRQPFMSDTDTQTHTNTHN